MKNFIEEKIIKRLVIIILLMIIVLIFTVIKDDIFKFISIIISILLPVILGLALTYILWPFVKKLQLYLKSRLLTIIIIYTMIIVIIGYLLFAFIPFIYLAFKQITEFINTFDFNLITSRINELVGNDQFVINAYSQLRENISIENEFELSAWLTGIFSAITSIISFSVNILIGVVISVYALMIYETIPHKFKIILPPNKRKQVLGLFYEINHGLRNYFKGLLTIILIDSFLAFLFYLIIGLDQALNLAIILGVFLPIPFLGYLLGGTAAFILAVSMYSFTRGIIVIIGLFVINMISANFIEPKIIGKKIKVEPIIVIIGLVIASSLWGVIGLILAMPLVTILGILYNNIKTSYDGWFEELQEIEEKNDNRSN